jgi:rubredoxin
MVVTIDRASVFMTVEVNKIPGGFRVDGLELLKGKCGCTSIAKCCYSWSKVKRKGSDIGFEAKMTTPETQENFDWVYTVTKGGITVRVVVEDAHDKEIYSGFIPPAISEWKEKGWEVKEQAGERGDGVVWRCAMCRWLYKDDREDTLFGELPDDWKCPKCNVSKDEFEKIG